jgi:hypothetical protein
MFLASTCEVDFNPRITFPQRLESWPSARQEWRSVICEIAGWLSNPTLIANEDGQSPSKWTIYQAWELAARLMETEPTFPDAVVPDGSGGITFEWRTGPMSRWIEVSATGLVEETIIRNGRLQSREKLSLLPVP